MIVTIKPIKKNSGWTEGYKEPRFKNTKDCLTAFYDKHGSRITGLTKEQEARLGIELKQDLNANAAFWDNYRIVMTNKSITLNTDKAEDELKLALLKAHYRVQNSELESNPRADYVIFDETLEANNIVSKGSIKIKAYVLYDGLSLEQKRDILRLYPGYSNTDNITASIIEARLFEELEKNHDKFVKLVEDVERDTKVFLKDLVTNHILTKNRTAYKYGDEVLGHNEDSTIEYINAPERQSLKLALMKELKELKSKK